MPDDFLQAILDDPDNDGPRLIYADWLEERGDPRGEFIRVQCALARMGQDDPERGRLEARDRSLRSSYRHKWSKAIVKIVSSGWVFRRGFVEAVALPGKDIRLVPRLFECAPTIQELHLGQVGDIVTELVSLPWMALVRGLFIHSDLVSTVDRMLSGSPDTPTKWCREPDEHIVVASSSRASRLVLVADRQAASGFAGPRRSAVFLAPSLRPELPGLRRTGGADFPIA